MRFFYSKEKGFTLVEMVVIVAIVAILAVVVFASLSEARKQSRDKQRMAEIDQLQVALRMYVDSNGSTMDCDGGFKVDGQSVYSDATIISDPLGKTCTDREKIFNFIKEYMGSVPHDPLGPGDPDHYYYFDPKHQCDVPNPAPLLFAVNLESTSSNIDTQCTHQSGNDGGLERTGSISPSIPYVKRMNFITHP